MSTSEGQPRPLLPLPEAYVERRAEPESRSLPTPTIYDKEAILSLPRHYIITQLREKGYTDLANKLPQVSNSDDHIHDVFGRIAAALNEERQEQFEEMLLTLRLDDGSLKEVYDSIVSEMFKGSNHWGKVVTFIVFTSHIVLYCAKTETLRHRVPDIVEWTDAMMQERLHYWIEEQGGWQAFVEHFDLENWRVSLSTGVLLLGVALSAVVSGLLFFKRILS